MKINEIFFLSIGALNDRKIRTVLTILMVVVGSSLMVVLNGLSAGQSNFIKKQLSQLASDAIFVSPGQRSFRGDSSPPSITINNAVVGKIQSLSFVNDVVPQYRGPAQLDSQGNTLNISILAMDPLKISVMYPSISFVDGSTTRQNDPSAMIVGYGIANPAGSSSPLVVVGQSVKATFTYVDLGGNQQRESKSFVVTGITTLSGNDQIDRLVIINQAAGDSFFHKSGKYDGLIVVAQSSEYLDPIQQEIKRLYGNTIGLSTPQSVLSLREQFTSGNNAFILSIGLIALIVGAVGIITTLYTSVTERVKEIGTMKAIGAQNRTIMALFLVEALLIGIIGATAGSLIGMGGGYFLSSFLFGGIPGSGSITITPVFLPEDLAKIWGLSVILSIGAGLYPAWKASKLSPMIALRRD